MLPDLDGLDVCRKLKRDPATRRIPVLMVSARGSESDIVEGLELGAEDYVTKPFSPRVLMARVTTAMRRMDPDQPREIAFAQGAVRIDPARHSVEVRGKEVDLTLTQYRILQYLALRPGFVRTRDQIIAAVRGEGTVLSSRAVDVHVAALRHRLGDYGDSIETVRGVGYRLAMDHAGVHA
jgi:two-component system phosphate regulon response regulator PhoB